MKILILGAGRVGESVAESLVSERNDITVIDTDPARLHELQERLDLRTVAGNGIQPSVLREAGVEDTDLLIACAPGDETNLVACKVAHEVFNVPTTIARLRQILFGASSEKTAEVLRSLAGKGPPAGESSIAAPVPGADGAKDAPAKAPGHGRNGAKDYPGANTVGVAHPLLKPGELCPECRRGKLYEMEPGVLVRVTGQAPLGATIYELQRLRCNLCLQVFNTPAPEGVGAQKYDAGAASMIALLKYGSGVPFYRLDGLQQSLGIVLPASTQWDIVEQGERLIQPVFEELVRQAAQGEVVHNDDTGAKILARMKPAQEDSPPGKAKRTGIFTTCIVSRHGARTIALFFTGKGHAGENLAQVAARAWPAFERLAAAHPDGRVAVVAHGGSNRAILCRALGLPLARILALEPIAVTLQGRPGDVMAQGLDYSELVVAGTFQGLRANVTTGTLNAAAIALAMTGEVDFAAGRLDMHGIVAPLGRVQSVLQHVPVIGQIVEARAIGVPMTVRGDLRDPTVVPLGPAAIGQSLVNLLGAVVKMPVDLFDPLVGGFKRAPE